MKQITILPLLLFLSLLTSMLPFLGITSAQQATVHVVQIGETLESIATIYGVSAEQIATTNNLTTDTILFAGQQLIIPQVSAIQTDEPLPTATPRGSTAGEVTTNVDVIDAGPTRIPITPSPTPLPYDPNRIVSIINPEPDQRFTINTDPVPVRGVVQFDPTEMLYWKLEIRGTSTRSRIWQNNDAMQSVPAFDWVTITTRTETVIDGHLGLIPAFPTLNQGNWFVRVVAVGLSGELLDEVVVPFRVSPEFDAVTAFIESPAPNDVLQPGDPISGAALLNWAISTYRVELIGGTYYSWTTIAHVQNDPADPIRINSGPLAQLPSDLALGQYRVRLIINGPDGNYIQEPYEVAFAVGDPEISNLATINFSSPNSLANNNNITAMDRVPIVGTVIIPDPNGYFKLEIIDADRLLDGQEPRFNFWTTIGDIHMESVVDGVIGEAPGIFTLPIGNYQLRIVIVDGDGNFSAVREFDLRIRD